MKKNLCLKKSIFHRTAEELREFTRENNIKLLRLLGYLRRRNNKKVEGETVESSNPFSCGTQVLDWKERNCRKCKTGYDEKNRKWNCWLESTLDYGLNTTGEFNKKFLYLIGYNKKTKAQLTWDCPARKAK